MNNLKNQTIVMGLALLSSLLVIGAVAKTPQGLYSDPAWQLEALQQYMTGISPTLNHTMVPKDQDLSQESAVWGIWWPPGTQLCTYPLMRHSVSMGHVLRLISALGLIIGAVGWACWISLFELDPLVQYGLVFMLPWMRYASNCLFLYHAEIFIFASAPWCLVIAYRLSRSWWLKKHLSWFHWISIFAFGFALGVRYLFKYSAAILSVNILIFFMLYTRMILKKPVIEILRTSSFLGRNLIFCMGAAIPVLTLSYLNLHYGGGMNGVTATAGFHPRWESLLAVFSNPALVMGDADSLLRFCLFNPDRVLLHNEIWLHLFGLPGGILLILLLLRRTNAREGPWFLMITIYGCSVVCMLLIWTISARAADFSARHMSSVGIAMLPLAIEQGWLWWQTTASARVRCGLAAGALAYIAIPLVYGYVSVFAKIIRTPDNYATSATQLYNPQLATENIEIIRRRLVSDFNPDTDIWYLTEPMTALELPGREIIRHADFMDVELLEKDHFQTKAPVQIHALLPDIFERNGKGSVIRNSFQGAGPWKRTELPGSPYLLWTARVMPVSE